MLRISSIPRAPRLARYAQNYYRSQNSTTRRELSYSSPGSSSSNPSKSPSPPSPSTPAESKVENSLEDQRSFRTPARLLNSPTYIAAVKTIAWMMGYNTKASTSIRETRFPYSQCAERDTQEAKFLHEDCRLAPTYQTWFQITNLHVWLLTARYRALPPTHGRIYIQELVNHFFIDVEHRMRVALAHKAPERVVKGYMKEMRDQWAGAGLALDLGLVGSDAELSGAVWRNIFAARGLDGKGEVIGKPGKVASSRGVTDAEQQQQSSSEGKSNEQGDVSIAPITHDELANLPFHLYVFTAYIRRELKRLESITDEEIIQGRIGTFGSFDSHVHAINRDFALEREERALLGLEEDIVSEGETSRPPSSRSTKPRRAAVSV